MSHDQYATKSNLRPDIRGWGHNFEGLPYRYVELLSYIALVPLKKALGF